MSEVHRVELVTVSRNVAAIRVEIKISNRKQWCSAVLKNKSARNCGVIKSTIVLEVPGKIVFAVDCRLNLTEHRLYSVHMSLCPSGAQLPVGTVTALFIRSPSKRVISFEIGVVFESRIYID